MSRHPSRRGASDVDAVAATRAYHDLIERLRHRIRESQARAARALNTELVMLYWSIGRDILDQQRTAGWGEGVVERIADDLRETSGGARGFSRRNLFYMRRFAELWPDAEKVPSVMAQISWTAHRILLDRFADEPELYLWYTSKAAENRWSVRHLGGQIDLKLHERQGAALTNFKLALEPADAERTLQATKDPYIFEFLELAEDTRERELEQALIDDVQKLLLELGTGFAFYGRQKALLIGDREFFLDLLFYHHALRRFVIVELKVGEFKPEYVSKMNFYLNAVDEQLRLGDDRESVGIILCTGRDETIAKLALHRVYAPIAVSTWQAGTPAPTLPPIEIADDVPSDLGELSELETVRAKLIDRVARRAPEIIDEDEKANQRR
jgi:predicted nuclease of restriction endonuclease-like (RecB) superfamily